MIKTFLMIVYMGAGQSQMMVTEQFPNATMCEVAREAVIEFYKENRNSLSWTTPIGTCIEINTYPAK